MTATVATMEVTENAPATVQRPGARTRRCSSMPAKKSTKGWGNRAHSAPEPLEKRYRVDAGGCWIWQRVTDKRGYGRMRWQGKTRFAHRVFYELHKGPIPDGLVIDHLCRTPACINPDHLEAVTQAENVKRGLHPPKKLTSGRLEEVLSLIEQGWPLSDIARAYGVTKGCVHAHKKRRA